jgi:hypothetical protein
MGSRMDRFAEINFAISAQKTKRKITVFGGKM